jgi:hypothetical protein
MTWIELTEERKERSILYRDYQNAALRHYAGTLARLHYGLERIDMTPRHDVDGWHIDANSWRLQLGARNGRGDGWLSFGGLGGKNWFRFRLARVAYMHAPTKSVTDVGGKPDYSRDNLSRSTHSMVIGPNNEEIAVASLYDWSRIWRLGSGWVDVRWRVDGYRVKEDIILDRSAREWITANPPTMTDPSQTYFGFVFQVDWDIPVVSLSGTGVQDKDADFSATDKAVIMRDVSNALLGMIPVSYLQVKSNTPVAPKVRMYKRFWKDESGHYLFVGVPVNEMTKLPDGDLVFDPTINEQVGTGTDDAEVDSDSDYQDTWGAIYIGNDSNVPDAQCGFRFQNVSIPQGATINSAYFKPTSNGSHSAHIDTVLRMQDADDAATFSNYSDFVGRPKTTASVTWDFGTGSDWTTAEELQSPDIAGPLGEVIERQGWASGNDLVVFWDDDGSTYGHMRAVYSYNGSSTYAAKLDATYTEAAEEESPLTLLGVG